jgi:small subunit ribosomal protein S1
MLSRDRARREAAWDKLEKEFEAGNRVEGVIFGRVKGGFTVDLGGAVAFLPGSQVDIRPVRDVGPLMDLPQPFQILKMDRRRGNIVVSRRAILEETRAEQRSGLIQSLAEGQVIDGVVKNITDYGAFVDLGGIDGLLHVTDISYKRVNHPSEVLNIGDTVKVQIIRINRETQRISLGMKQLESDPWEGARQISGRRHVQGPGHQHHRIWRLRRAGAGHRGPGPRLRDELDQEERPPGQDRLDQQEVDVKVLEVDEEKRRISLGLKQAQANPWADFAERIRSARGRGRGQERDRVRPVRRPRRRRRRHGPHVGHRLGRVGRGSAWRFTARARRSRRRCSTSTSRRSASRSA